MSRAEPPVTVAGSAGFQPIVLFLFILSAIVFSPVAQALEEQKLFSFDEKQWVLFYDLPSRRFRLVRDEFLRREFDAASQDLKVASSHIRVEALRATPALAEKMQGVADQLEQLSDSLDKTSVTIATFDPLFARAHWLLAQHYLQQATASRDAKRDKLAGHYLIATAHHLERTVLWSNARLSVSTVKTLDEIRVLANDLVEGTAIQKAYRQRPVKKAWQLLVDLGAELDRNVTVSAP